MQQQVKQNEIYKHYIALDWSKKNFALASIRDYGTSFKVKEYPPDLMNQWKEIRKKIKR